MNKEQVIAEIKYQISNKCLKKLLEQGKINEKEFNKADKFLFRKYKGEFSAI